MFDLSDVEAELDRARRTEAQLRRAREIAARAFAQGFTAALEDGNASDWLDHYTPRTEGHVIKYAVVEDTPREDFLQGLGGLWLADTCAGGTWSASFDDAVWFETPELAAVSLSDGEQEINRETCSLVELMLDGPRVISQRIVPWPEPAPAPAPIATVLK